MLEKGNIILRTVEPSDIDFLLEVENNINYWKVSNTLIPFNRATMEKYVNAVHNIIADEQARFIIVNKTTGESMGTIDLFEYHPIHRRCGVGILILEEFRQQSVAATSLEITEAYCKSVLKLNQLHCSILEDNERSVSLFTKAGFSKCGERTHWLLDDNMEWKSELLFQKILE